MSDGQSRQTPRVPIHQRLDIVALSQLDTLLEQANQVLLKCNTVFPFDLFPNTLIIDYNKVDIIYRSFFATSQTVSVPIARVNHVTVDVVTFGYAEDRGEGYGQESSSADVPAGARRAPGQEPSVRPGRRA